MECIPASEVAAGKLDEFLTSNRQIKKDSFINNGYVVQSNGKIIGCFEMEMIEYDGYWLKQLYIIQNEAAKLPVLLEYILLFAKGKEAKVIYAHSEQPVTDLLLQSLRFSLQTDQLDTLKDIQKGHWWTYQVG